MEKYNIIVENENDTVVSEYKPLANKAKDYQTESELESQFISILKNQGYEYLNIHNEEDLINNLRQQIELLNKINFSDNEWKKFFNENIANKNFSIKDKSRIIQEDYRQLLTRDDGSHKNIILIDKDNIHNNKLQVINQYEEETGNYKNRYDVTILVNGIPMVHIELKRRGVALKEAFNQIIRYQRDSFWASNGLYEYVQVFVISNGANTKYYSNTTRLQHVNKKSDMIDSKTSKSFEFTHFWSDSKNNPIHDLIDFTSTFFSKHTILNILTKYCIFTSEEMLLVMRPYQIVAVEKIINKINISHNYKKYGSIAAGGFIWHTTGSGKTLTSFKTAKLASQLPYINKVIFVVDRRDLDYQTMKEYDKLEKGAANSNRSTSILQRQLESNDPNKKIIITTIQKLSIFIKIIEIILFLIKKLF
nr:type I restriction endonuclease [Metamycoplasma hominis]